ncbi:MAG: hypothetical protein E5W91_22685 [Mesorhizobium sp.]|uniref:hypothetical protein n=1 Tax=Mesorhizobium sp. TaxID=1871066 RepID=UPI001227498F|nr:hypothetical protein [Mesorhizobium sp.]TIS55252.1 MAG: hypothetical protein E5W91_22685 [Mesorhizobium sp.]
MADASGLLKGIEDRRQAVLDESDLRVVTGKAMPCREFLRAFGGRQRPLGGAQDVQGHLALVRPTDEPVEFFRGRPRRLFGCSSGFHSGS